MRPIRVLHLRDTHEIGGPGKTILETFRAIDADRFELHLGVFRARAESSGSPFIEAARAAGLPVHEIRGFNQYDPRLITGTVKLVRDLNIDILHGHEVKSDTIAYLAARLRRVPIVTTLHGWIGNSRKQRFMIWLDKVVARRFDRVIVVSGLIRDEMAASGMQPDRLRLLHNAIVLQRYTRTGRRGFLSDLVGRPLGAPILTSIGRLSSEKGHVDFVEALAIVAAQEKPVTAVLVGDGPERQRLLERIHALGLANSVHLPGYIDPPQRVLEDTDLAVLPSHTEGLPNAALEALAMEVPVLATRVGGTPEVITDGETGRLVEARSPRALAAAILEFLGDPAGWKRMAQRGREAVVQRFDFGTRTRRLEAIYTELAGSVR